MPGTPTPNPSPQGGGERRLRPEMLRKLQGLTLVVRARARPVEHARPLGHALVDEAADDLAVLQDEGHVAGADLEDRARARPPRTGVAEAGIEEAGVVDPELAD